MSFLAPVWLWALLVAAGLVVLYLVRRRHRPLDVPFLGLWLEAVTAEAPRIQARRLRSIASLLVEIAVVAAAALALARPYRPIELPESRPVAVVVDVSPSMDVRVGGGPERRIDRAKAAAHRLLQGSSSTDAVLLASSEGDGTVLSPFGAPPADAAWAIDSLRPAIESDPVAAVDRAAALVRDRDGDVVLVTDLAGAKSRAASARPGVRTVAVVDEETNVAIAKVELIGGRGAPRSLGVSVRCYSDREATRTVRAAPADAPDAPIAEASLAIAANSEATASLAVPDDAAGLLRVSLDPGDAFPADDVAIADLGRSAGLRVLVLSRGESSAPLRAALRSLAGIVDPARTSIAPPERWGELRDRYDLAIFDRSAPDAALGPAIVLGADSPPPPVRIAETIVDAGLVEAARDDPVVAHLDFEGLRVGAATTLDVSLDPSASVLLRCSAGPLLVVSRARAPLAVCGFSLEESASNLWLFPAFPVLLGRLVSSLARPPEIVHRHPGEALSLPREAAGAAEPVALVDAAGRTAATVGATGIVPWMPAGAYRVRGAASPAASDVTIAIDLQRADVSDVRCARPPAPSAAREPKRKEGRQELWILFATAALGLLALHWFLFGTGAPRR
jgi:aerotolerance regulator-like protein/VWA domain-containing protein